MYFNKRVKMSYRVMIFISVVSLFSQSISSQTKNEKEERIKISAFPKKALNILEHLPDECKRIKYYKETDNEKLSFEVKFKFDKQHYSVEFSENGDLEDIEITTKIEKIEKSARTQIEEYFNQSYTNYKILKIQEQYIYNSEISTSQFLKNIFSENKRDIDNFEIIAEIKNNKKQSIREFLFNKNGVFLRYRTLKPTSYEHVLY